jgi:hypothetical protein
MKNPSSKNDGTTGAWSAFKDAYNKVGKETAEQRRKNYETLKKLDKNSGVNKKK